MSTNRYGQIWHGDHHHINIRFPSTEARLKFQNEFEAYHASHDHEGEVPTFKCVSSKDLKLSTGSRSPQDLVKAETDDAYRISIDGYSWNEIHDYHNPSGLSQYTWYSVPTCCVPPIIVIDRAFVDSGTLQRHPLSAIFGDMPDTDFQSLLDSVQADGFIDPIVRIYEGQILDGWHRYRAAQALNLVRRLKFQVWNEDGHRDGDPKAFVLARNIERRHLNPSQRAQIAVAFNERFGHGGDRSKTPNGVLKTKKELAAQANVGTSTIDRAVVVEKAGQSEAVIAGEKTTGEVLEEQKSERDNEREVAIAGVKPLFQNAVETWRSLQVERLRKFEHLPVGRTPLIESEYLKTYFELAQPRIPQNTKPTAAHYEGAIACIRDLPVAFAEQLAGRHYRRIIKEWDASVLLQLVERFQSGHILGYPALQTDSDANAVRIRQAIRDHYGFQGRITTQPFEVLFEITEDAHAVLVQLNPKEWIRDGREISWALSVLPEPIDTQEIGTEETVKDLRAKVSEEMPKWKQRHTGVSYASQSTLIEAYREQIESEQEGAATAEELKGLLKLMRENAKSYALRVRYSRSDERKAYETARNSYFKARGDLREKIAEKEVDLSAFIEAAKLQYHRTNIVGMFGTPHDILRDGTLTAATFEDWTGFLRVLSVDVEAAAPWVPVSEETEALQHYRAAEKKMWAAFETSDLSAYLDRDDFSEAACEQHPLWGVTEFPDSMETDIPAIWEARFGLLLTEIEMPASWIQTLLTEFRMDDESETDDPDEIDMPEQPPQSQSEREANKLLKQKKQALKSMWDKRKQAHKDWLGESDTDLNQYLCLTDLEKGFAEYEAHAYCADAFRSAYQRTSETSFNIVVEKTLKSDISLEVLQQEARAMDTYAYDILKWEQQEWIQQLIEAKKAKAETQKATPEKQQTEAERLSSELDCAHGTAEDARKRVWDAFRDSALLKNVSKANFAIAAAKHHNRYEDGYGSAENYLLGEDYAPIDQLNLKEAQAMCEFFAAVAAEIQEPADWIEALADGLAAVDVQALRNTVSAALESLGASDMNWDFKGRLSADLNNVFLEYENVPNTKECVIALLDAADTLLSEFD